MMLSLVSTSFSAVATNAIRQKEQVVLTTLHLGIIPNSLLMDIANTCMQQTSRTALGNSTVLL